MAHLNHSLFKEYINSKNKLKRIKAIDSAIFLKENTTLPDFIARLSVETDPEVIIKLIVAIGTFGNKSHIPAIKQFQWIDNTEIQQAIEKAIELIRINENLTPKIKQLKSILYRSKIEKDENSPGIDDSIQLKVEVDNEEVEITRKRLGEILVDSKLITEEELIKSLNEQRDTQSVLGELLMKNKLVTEEDLIHALAYQNNLKYVNLNEIILNKHILKVFPIAFLKKLQFIPFKVIGNILYIIVKDIDFPKETVEKATGKKVSLLISSSRKIEEKLEELELEQLH